MAHDGNFDYLYSHKIFKLTNHKNSWLEIQRIIGHKICT